MVAGIEECKNMGSPPRPAQWRDSAGQFIPDTFGVRDELNSHIPNVVTSFVTLRDPEVILKQKLHSGAT
jgi:hypothetical protein